MQVISDHPYTVFIFTVCGHTSFLDTLKSEEFTWQCQAMEGKQKIGKEPFTKQHNAKYVWYFHSIFFIFQNVFYDRATEWDSPVSHSRATQLTLEIAKEISHWLNH